MAQLVKVFDYISRYEQDIFHYPSQFIRLKKQNWKKIYQAWEVQKEEQLINENDQEDEEESRFFKWKKFLTRREESDIEHFSTNDEKERLPSTDSDLKHYFLNSLFPFQLKWASTTIGEMSFVDRQLHDDFTLKYFLMRFPDTYLLLYNPVFNIKNNPLESDLILITPISIDIIKIIEFDSDITISVGDDRTWYKEDDQIQSRIISPMVSLKRTEKVVKSVLTSYNLDFPVNKIVLSRTNRINFQLEPYKTSLIDVNQHEQWLTNYRTLNSPLKHKQLKVCEALLKHCSTISVKRPEWDEDSDSYLLR